MLGLLSNFSFQPVLHDWYLVMCTPVCGKEENVLFNDAFNTFYLRLYCVRHMVKDTQISSKGSFICIIHQSWSTGWNEKWLNNPTMKDRSDNPSHHECSLLPRSHMTSSDFRQMIRTPKPLVPIQFHYPV